MSRLIDADELLKEINTWCDCVDGACLLKNAPTVKAVPIDRLKQFRNEVMNMNSIAIIQRLDKLIAESEGVNETH